MRAIRFRLWCVGTNTGMKLEAAGLESRLGVERVGGVGTGPRDQWAMTTTKEGSEIQQQVDSSGIQPGISVFL